MGYVIVITTIHCETLCLPSLTEYMAVLAGCLLKELCLGRNDDPSLSMVIQHVSDMYYTGHTT